MSDIAIRVDNLSKRYRLGEDAPHLRVTEAVADLVRRPFRAADTPRSERPDLWALRDVSFEVQRGEVLGIIGRNGAGKSTLLKILSRITEPTAGRAVLHGRVGSLLEVGTGFHEEFTGRENIYINGAILGMTRAEINRRFDEIVAFSELEDFLDTPIKRYSTGMKTRLAFAIAAHLEPEILIVDEVLAVGDIAFQKKCLGKMNEVARSGRTVLFVSHNMGAVLQLCTRVLHFTGGKLVDAGDPANVIDGYVRYDANSTHCVYTQNERTQASESDQIQLIYGEIQDSTGNTATQLKFNEPFSVIMSWRKNTPSIRAFYTVFLVNRFDQIVVTANTRQAIDLDLDSCGTNTLRCDFPPLGLLPGQYSCTFLASAGDKRLAEKEKPLMFSVSEAPYDPQHCFMFTREATIAPNVQWQTLTGPPVAHTH